MITKQEKEYAEKMSVLGDKLINITKQFPSTEKGDTVEEIKIKYNKYLKTVNDFKDYKLTFELNIYQDSYPAKIKNEHEELVEQIQKFIDGTDSMSKSLDISNSFLDKDNLVKGVIFDKDMLEKGLRYNKNQ
ncbi:MAG: hypothetical protein ACREV6_21525 [Clostridium sp.]|uniref:hypothetical protein n=1 Tax=Clostridium sp. TaxID=1506 RepID=UPI003D6D80DE